MLDKPFVPKKVKALAAHLGCDESLALDILKAIFLDSMKSEGEEVEIAATIRPAEAVTDSDDADEGLPTGPAFVQSPEVPKPRQRKARTAPVSVMPIAECGPWRLRRVVAETGKLVDADVRRLVEEYENAPENDPKAALAWDALTAAGWERAA